MADNFKESGELLDFVVPTGEATVSGEIAIIGNMIGVALGTAAEDETVVVKTTGVFELAKTTSLTINQGDTLHWNTSTKKVTKTVTHVRIGVAWEGAASAATTVKVKLSNDGLAGNIAANQAANATANGSDAATTQALANSLKADFNALLAKLKAAGLMVAD